MDSNLSNKTQTEIPFRTHYVSSIESHEFNLLRWALNHSSVIALDAEWKPSSAPNPKSFPPVSLLQIASRVSGFPDSNVSGNDYWVFLLDLQSVPLSAIYELLRDMFVSPHILKLGFKFKQDFAYLSSTFCSNGCEPGFEKVEPFLDITSIYYYLEDTDAGQKLRKETKSLAAICEELLGFHLSKEFQCSDWSCRPLTEEQKSYAAADAYYLLEIFYIFQFKFHVKASAGNNFSETSGSNEAHGLEEMLEKLDMSDSNLLSNHTVIEPTPLFFSRNTLPMDSSLLNLVQKYGERIILKDSDRRPRASKRKGRRQSSVGSTQKVSLEVESDWQGLPLWDLSVGGDGCPKFLCDVMVEGLAKHLRCVGFDAAVPPSRKPEPRELINQAHKEKRVLLTRDAKLLKHQYLVKNQVYRVKSLLKNDQLLEVIETFRLIVCEDQLMSRCTKCNGSFIQKPLTVEEALEAAKGFQVIPNCLFDRNIEFWQCTDCSQLYWEGTQYHNAVQKFINVCKLKE